MAGRAAKDWERVESHQSEARGMEEEREGGGGGGGGEEEERSWLSAREEELARCPEERE